jgi:outer membrane receptor protein involved in Fe transport
VTTAYGKFGFQLEASMVDSFKSSDQLPQYLGGGEELVDFVGGNTSSQGAFPRWRGNLRTEWERDDWILGARVNMVGSYEQRARSVNFRGEERPDRIPEHYTLDLTAQYRVNKDLRVFVGLNNITNKLPPFDPRQDTYGFAVDQYAPLGRSAYMSLRYNFE